MSFYFPQSLKTKLSWENFYIIVLKGLKVYAFYLAVLSVFRLFFIFGLHDYIGKGVEAADILTAISRGFRLSMQTAGALTLISFVPAFLAHYIYPRLEKYIFAVVNGLILIALSILQLASFPFYRQFRMNFNQMLFNGANDDIYALFITMVQEYYLPVRLLLAFILAFILGKILLWWLARPSIAKIINERLRLPKIIKYAARIVFLYIVYLAVLLGIFGGSLGWQTAVDWENAGVTKDDFLNEAILDSPQAIYRAWNLNNRMLACNGLNFTAEDIKNLAAVMAKRAPDSDNLDVYLTRTAKGAKIKPPKQVFIIISESLANWPLLEKYKSIPIASGLRSIIAAEDSDYCPTMLPNGASTVSAVTGIVTGLADANLYLTTMPESFSAPYPTASAKALKELGYQTNFYYAGPATWERIGAFTKAQGFEHFYSRGDFGDVPGSVWGCEDEYLYSAVLKSVAENKDAMTFNVILNASNHSPYDIDLAAKGFPKEEVRNSLPQDVQNDEDLLKELGHYWYADRELAKFVKNIKTDYPESLVIIVGDHGDRYNIEKQPPTYERYAIPFIITGAGIYKGILASDAAGSQIDIVPTIIELIAPKGFNYLSLGTSLTENRQGVNYGFWITRKAIGKADTVPLVVEPIDENVPPPAIDDNAMQDYINAVRAISWYRPKYGAIIDERLLENR